MKIPIRKRHLVESRNQTLFNILSTKFHPNEITVINSGCVMLNRKCYFLSVIASSIIINATHIKNHIHHSKLPSLVIIPKHQKIEIDLKGQPITNFLSSFHHDNT